MTVDPAIRRSNRLLFFALVIFAIGFCVAILLWMRVRTERKGGRVYPPTSQTVPAASPCPSSVAFVVLPSTFFQLHAL